MLDEAVSSCGVRAALRVLFAGQPFEVDRDEKIVGLVREHSRGKVTGLPFWPDSALLAAAGIPTVVFGPSGAGAHGNDEWVDLASVARVRDILIATANAYCSWGRVADAIAVARPPKHRRARSPWKRLY